MLEWLLRDRRAAPTVELHGRTLPIAIRHRADAQRMTLRLAPDGSEVRLSVPRSVRQDEAIGFVRARADWLARQLAAVPVAAPIAPGGTLPYRGVALTIAHGQATPRGPRVVDGALLCGGPLETLRARLARWLETEARQLLAEDLAHYCARAAAASAPRLALSRAQRRWGSCSASGTIRINWRLVMAPDMVRRSVVAHEVAHLLHFDHSPRFHAVLARIFEGDITVANAWLKDHGRTLYAPLG